jgi:hypothetical protein
MQMVDKENGVGLLETEEELLGEWDAESSESSVLSEEEALKAVDAKEMKRVTQEIDRDEEDKLIQEYKKTKDEKTLLQLYGLREQTLAYWTRRYSYLSDNMEELFSDFRSVWFRCVERYEYGARQRVVKDRKGRLVLDKGGKTKKRLKRTPFNTYLYTSLTYWVRNLIKKRYSKKRTDIHGIPSTDILVSMDGDIGTSSTEPFTLHDILTKKIPHVSSDMSTDEIIDLFADGDAEIKRAMGLLAYDPNVKKLSVAARMKSGEFNISKREQDALVNRKKRSISALKQRIKKMGTCGSDFKLMSYQVFEGYVSYEVLTKDMRLFNKIVKKVQSKKNRFDRILS